MKVHLKQTENRWMLSPADAEYTPPEVGRHYIQIQIGYRDEPFSDKVECFVERDGETTRFIPDSEWGEWLRELADHEDLILGDAEKHLLDKDIMPMRSAGPLGFMPNIWDELVEGWKALNYFVSFDAQGHH